VKWVAPRSAIFALLLVAALLFITLTAPSEQANKTVPELPPPVDNRNKNRSVSGTADPEDNKDQIKLVEEEKHATQMLAEQPDSRGTATSTKRIKQEAKANAVGRLGNLIETLLGDRSPQSSMTGVLQGDPRNSGIDITASYGSGRSVLVLNLRSISGETSQGDVFRVLVQYAQAVKDRSFTKVMLQYRGEDRFMLKGDYFKTLGEEYEPHNSVRTMRTLPENVLLPDGSRAFGSWTGDWIRVVGKQMEDFGDFNKQWYLNDLLAEFVK
jgi:hypothetical protein